MWNVRVSSVNDQQIRIVAKRSIVMCDVYTKMTTMVVLEINTDANETKRNEWECAEDYFFLILIESN